MKLFSFVAFCQLGSAFSALLPDIALDQTLNVWTKGNNSEIEEEVRTGVQGTLNAKYIFNSGHCQRGKSRKDYPGWIKIKQDSR